MKKEIGIIFFVAVAALNAADIVFSRDSLRVFNAKTMSLSDTLTMTNNGSQQVFIESLQVHFDILDTTGPFDSANERFDVVLLELGNGTSYAHNDQMISIGNHSYSIRFLAESRPPYPIAPGGTTRLAGLVFGNFNTSAMGKYPKYLQGTMYLFFSNGNMDSLHIYSDDLRTAINRGSVLLRLPEVGNRGRSSGRFLINGRILTEQITGTVACRTPPMYRIYRFPREQ